MDFALTDEQLAIQEMARRFAEDELAPKAAEWDEKHHFPVDVIKKTAELGLAGIYTRDDYYFNYKNDALKAVMAEVNTTTDDAHRSELLKEAQTIIADDYVNGYLFQLAKTGVADARIEGLWENSPTPANDLSKVHWTE